jgi:hypothetical protein
MKYYIRRKDGSKSIFDYVTPLGLKEALLLIKQHSVSSLKLLIHE